MKFDAFPQMSLTIGMVHYTHNSLQFLSDFLAIIFFLLPYMFVNIQSSWVRNKNTHMVGCSQIIPNDDIHIVQNKYKQFDCVRGETVCAYWSWTHSVSIKYKQVHHVNSQTVCAYWSWTHIVSNNYK